jgi:hypothetical protein
MVIVKKDLRDAERVVLGVSSVVFGIARIWLRHRDKLRWFESKSQESSVATNSLGGAPSFERRLGMHGSHYTA